MHSASDVEDTILSFSELGLNSDCLATLEQAGYKEPTELQQQLIPLIKEKKNVLVKSQSASGKTGAFLIPAINYVLDNPLEDYRGARVMILTSRKDRVNQIKYTVKKLATSQNFRFGFIVSGRPYQPQMRLLRRPLDIMVATPGRLSDLSDNGKADFSQLEMLIVDDLASIYHKEFHGLIDKILSQRSTEYPIVLFVRDDDDVVNYAKTLIPNAIVLEVEEDKNPLAKIPQTLQICDDYTHKIAIMDYLLDDYQGESTLIYTSNDKAAAYLADNLANHGHTADIASKLTSDELLQSSTLIVSDESFTQLSSYDFKHIVHFELPKSISNYTLRLDGKGWENRDNPVVALVGIQERESLKSIEELLGKTLERQGVPGLESLNPFMTLKPDFSSNKSNKKKENQQQKRRNSGQFGKRRGAGTDQRKNEKSQDDQQRRAKKGRFGRLSGGIHRKREEASTPNSSSKKPKKNSQQPNKTRSTRPNNNGQNTNNSHKNRSSNPKQPQGRTNVNYKTKGLKDNKWTGGQNSAFPVIKDQQDAVSEVDETKVVIRYKDKKRFLKQ